jgi:methylenetetrahydrofolate reductase (NADPH)
MSQAAMDQTSFRASRDGVRPIRVSFEFFPPKTPEMEATLWASVERLAPLHPQFVSVTYGAGGSTRERTHNTVARIVRETSVKPAAHLTCVGATRDEVDEVVRSYWDAGVRHIVALRGDPVTGIGTKYEPHPGGYAQACHLVEGIKKVADFEVSVSAYPEKHPEAASLAADIDALKAKVDAGASRAMTQFFFNNDLYLRYLDQVRSRGIDIPIVPGILPRRGQHPGLARGPVRGPRPGCGDPQADRSGGRRRAGARSRRPRRHRVPLLYDEPRRPRLCRLPPARPARANAAGKGACGGVT